MFRCKNLDSNSAYTACFPNEKMLVARHKETGSLSQLVSFGNNKSDSDNITAIDEKVGVVSSSTWQTHTQPRSDEFSGDSFVLTNKPKANTYFDLGIRRPECHIFYLTHQQHHALYTTIRYL